MYRAAQLHQGDENRLQLQRFEQESVTFLNFKGHSYVQTITIDGKSATIQRHLVSDQTKKNQESDQPEKQLTLKVLLNEKFNCISRSDKIIPLVTSKVFLSDKTSIAGTTWENLKAQAMTDDF